MAVVRAARAEMFGLSFCDPLDQDEPAQLARDWAMKVLKEMNELQQFENDNWNQGGV